MTMPRQIAVCRSYDDLRRAIVAWCEQIGMYRGELDVQAGLADGHSAKLLSPRAVKKFGNVTLGRVLAATGLVLILAEDPEAIDLRVPGSEDADGNACGRRPPGQRPAQHWRTTKSRAWGRRMAARRALVLPAERRREIARKAAAARWQRQDVDS